MSGKYWCFGKYILGWHHPLARIHLMALCGAKSKRNDGAPCRVAAMPNGRCYIHGGASNGSGTFKDGRHSKFLPPQLRAAYAEARKDQELVNLSDEIALVDARMHQ